MEAATLTPPLEQSSTIQKAFEAQRKHYLQRPMPDYHSRMAHLKRLQSWILAHRQEISEAIYLDFKKPHTETEVSELIPVIGEIKHTRKHLREWMQPKRVPTPMNMMGSRAEILYEPKGVSLIIGPWNYPFSLMVGPLVSSLAAGCTAILKPSEMTPHTAALISTMVQELYRPEEVTVFEGDVAVSTALLKLPFDHIFFTGSPAVGKIVMRAASDHLTSVTLELGGKSPAVVDPSAHLKSTAEKLAWGKCLNNGQTCIAPDYALVPENMVEPLVAAMKVATKKMLDPEGKGIQQAGNYARIVNERHYKRLISALDEAVAAGARVVMGGEKDDLDCYLSPTVIVDVPEHCSLLQEEIFGPILPIRTYQNLEEAISYIKDKPKPLALYYFGKSNTRMRTLLRQTSAGGVVTNDTVLHFSHAELPFGGVNTSGIGKGHGHHGFLAFTNEKGTMRQLRRTSLSKLIYPPYTGLVKRFADLIMKFF